MQPSARERVDSVAAKGVGHLTIELVLAYCSQLLRNSKFILVFIVAQILQILLSVLIFVTVSYVLNLTNSTVVDGNIIRFEN
jgi:hypothetical protein